MTRIATVASIATGPLKKVLNITAKLITNTIVSQMPKNALAKLTRNGASAARRYKSGMAMPKY